jgi:hypothetical protein
MMEYHTKHLTASPETLSILKNVRAQECDTFTTIMGYN